MVDPDHVHLTSCPCLVWHWDVQPVKLCKLTKEIDKYINKCNKLKKYSRCSDSVIMFESLSGQWYSKVTSNIIFEFKFLFFYQHLIIFHFTYLQCERPTVHRISLAPALALHKLPSSETRWDVIRENESVVKSYSV